MRPILRLAFFNSVVIYYRRSSSIRQCFRLHFLKRHRNLPFETVGRFIPSISGRSMLPFWVCRGDIRRWRLHQSTKIEFDRWWSLVWTLPVSCKGGTIAVICPFQRGIGRCLNTVSRGSSFSGFWVAELGLATCPISQSIVWTVKCNKSENTGT